MAGIDERKIEEIVARVLERLGGSDPGISQASVGRIGAAAGDAPKPKANIPRGTNGVFQDADEAAKAARRAFEQNERTPISTRVKMVENMRRAVLSNNDALSRYAVEETAHRSLRVL